MNMIDHTTVAISISGIELAALQKLSLVGHALATKLDHSGSQELKILVSVLDDLVRQISIKSAQR